MNGTLKVFNAGLRIKYKGLILCDSLNETFKVLYV